MYTHQLETSRILSERAELQAKLGTSESLAGEMETVKAVQANMNKELALR